MRNDLTCAVISPHQSELIAQHEHYKANRAKIRNAPFKPSAKLVPKTIVRKVYCDRSDGAEKAKKRAKARKITKKKIAVFRGKDANCHVIFYKSLMRFIELGGAVSYPKKVSRHKLILCETIDAHGLNIQAIRGERLYKPLVYARQEYCYRALQEGDASLREIGELIGRTYGAVRHLIGGYGVRCGVETRFNAEYLKHYTPVAHKRGVVK